MTNADGFGGNYGGPPGEGEPGRVRFNPAYGARNQETLPSWQIDLRQQISRLRTSLSRTRYEGPDFELATEIDRRLRAAEERLGELSGQGWLRRNLLADGVYEQVLASVMTASEDLLLIQDESTVRARMPSIRAALKAFIDVSDPRFDDYLRVIDTVAASGSADGGPPDDGGTAAEPDMPPYGGIDV